MTASGNVGLAFVLVVAAGGASSVGAAIVFAVGLASPRLLASSLGFAAGVMIYVVFAEIFTNDSQRSFQKGGYSEVASYRLTTLCFFAGMLLTAGLDVAVHKLMHLAGERKRQQSGGRGEQHGSDETGSQAELITTPLASHQPGALELQPPRCICGEDPCACDADKDLESGSGSDKLAAGAPRNALCCTSPETCCRKNPDCCGACCAAQDPHCCGPTAGMAPAGDAAEDIAAGTAAAEVVALLQSDEHTRDLLRMGVITGVAIAIHNIPEGLATFVGALSDAKVGGSIAAAIAIHNIPEGICVAMPIYYATGNKLKAFLWGSLTGFAEPLGGLLGFLVLDQEEPLTFAVVFGLVAGIMAFVSFKELLPSAFRFDPADSVVSNSIIAGMAVMAASLLLFTI